MKKSKSRQGGSPHVGMSRACINGDDNWKELSGPSKIAYWYLKGRYNGTNNGEISLPYSALLGIRGCGSRATISKAFKELEAKEWIIRKRAGGLHRFDSFYALTFRFDKYGK